MRKLQDAIRRGFVHERTERAPDQVVRDRLRRVERAGRLADAGAGVKRYRSAVDLRRVVQQRLVDGAELLDAEIAIRDALVCLR